MKYAIGSFLIKTDHFFKKAANFAFVVPPCFSFFERDFLNICVYVKGVTQTIQEKDCTYNLLTTLLNGCSALCQRPDVIIRKPQRFNFGQLGLVGECWQDTSEEESFHEIS